MWVAIQPLHKILQSIYITMLEKGASLTTFDPFEHNTPWPDALTNLHAIGTIQNMQKDALEIQILEHKL